MIVPALLAAVLLSNPVKAPSAPAPQSAVFALSSCGDCRHAPAVVAGGAPGTFTAQWSAVVGFSTFFRTFDASGNATPEQPVALNNLSKGAGVGTAADGSFRMGWLHPGEVFVRRLGPNGALDGDAIHVNAGHPTGVDDDDASLAVRPDGGFLLVWDRLPQGAAITPHILSRRGDASGALGPFVELGTTTGRSFPIACFTPSGGSVVAWTLRHEPIDGDPAPAGIALRRIAPDGTPLGTVVEAVPPKDVTTDLGLALACARDGGFYVAWHTLQRPAKSGNDIVVQRFNAAGAKVGQPLRLNTVTAGDQTSPALLFERDGRLLVAWASAKGEQGEIRGRRISSKGRPAGPEFLLHRAAAGVPVSYPSLATVGERGQFVVTWNEGEKNFARIFRP
jgi:hypothetical protein